MGGAPSNPAARNQVWVWLLKPSGCHCTGAFGGQTKLVECRPLLGALPLSLTSGRRGQCCTKNTTKENTHKNNNNNNNRYNDDDNNNTQKKPNTPRSVLGRGGPEQALGAAPERHAPRGGAKDCAQKINTSEIIVDFQRPFPMDVQFIFQWNVTFQRYVPKDCHLFSGCLLGLSNGFSAAFSDGFQLC